MSYFDTPRTRDPEWTPYLRDWHARKYRTSRLPGWVTRVLGLDREPEPTLEEARPQDPERRVRIAEVVDACAAFAHISRTEIRADRRAHRIVRPRQAAMYLAAKHCRQSLPQIGRALGGRDHSTVIHGRDKVAEDLAAGGEIFGEIVDHVERELGLR